MLSECLIRPKHVPFDRENTDRRPDNPSHQTLKCLYTNIDDLNNKTAELEALLDKEQPDLVFLTETKCNKDTLSSNNSNTKNYTAIRKDRPVQIAPGGGVALLINNRLYADENSISHLNDHQGQEAVWCEVKSKGGKGLVIGTIYRTLSSSSDNNDLICDLIRVSEPYILGISRY